MTSIAYKDGMMAGDSRVTFDNTVLPDTGRKVHRLRNGCLFGAAGSAEEIEKLKRTVMRNEDPPKSKDVSALKVDPDGTIWCYEGEIWSKVRTPFAALGSGTIAALAAMYAGADAKEAVKIAIKLDTHSGGRVNVVRLRE